MLGPCFPSAPVPIIDYICVPFYSHKFTSIESNYDVGNRELLAVNLALEW